MLDELHVTNLALIHEATVEPAPGLTVLTGETGAGKSALLSAIKLMIGERASGDQVRDGADALSVEARFICADDTDPDGRVCTRRVSREGRSRCTIDGAIATVGQLSALLGASVDLCGQHDHQALLSAHSHMAFLDAWGAARITRALEAYRQAWKLYAEADAHVEHVRSAVSEERAHIDEARFTLRRINEIDPQPGEYEQLESELPRLEHGEALMRAAYEAHQGLAGDGCVLEQLAGAIDALNDVAEFDPELVSTVHILSEAVFLCEDAQRNLRVYRDGLEFDPQMFEQIQSRMDDLIDLQRQFGPRMEDVFARRDEARELVSLVDDSEASLAEAEKKLAAADTALLQAAHDLHQIRSDIAPQFAQAVTEQMHRLEMEGAELVVELEELPRQQWTSSGSDRVEFTYRPGSGMTLRPFTRIASGGEASRVMLATKVALGTADQVETLVFDEIDAGVGGSTARAVADVLADLARTHQVIVVTHLAQIAVQAERHYVVTKTVSHKDGLPQTSISLVEGQDRVQEIARMLSGDNTRASLEHAAEMLASRLP